MRLFPDRLGPKLNLLLVGSVVLLGVAMAALIFFGFERTQSEATRSSREGLEVEGKRNLGTMTQVQAAFGQSQMETTAGFAQQAARYVVDRSAAAPGEPFDTSRLATLPSGIRYDATTGRRSDLLIPAGATLDDAALRTITESGALDELFPILLQGYSSESRSADYDAIQIYYQTVHNVTRVYPPVVDVAALPAVGADQVLAETMKYGPDANPERKTMWTAPYDDSLGRGLVITAYVPVYQGNEYLGVIGVDLSLERLVDQVEQVRPTASGFAFYIDTEGNLLPTAEALIVRAEIDDPHNAEFAEVTAAMKAGRADVLQAEIDGREMFVAFTPMRGIGGTFALAAPVDEITQQAAEVEASIDEGGRRTLVFALAAMAGVFVVGLAAATWLNRKLVLDPVSEIVRGTRALAAGDLGASIPVRSDDELGVLAQSFNTMSGVLRERTDALRDSEAELSALFAAMTDVVAVVDRSGRFLNIAPTSQAEYLAPTHMLAGRTVYEVYPPEDAEHLMRPVLRALETGRPQNIEYRTMFGEEERWFAASISPRSADDVVVVSRDITERREQEKELREREEQYRSTFESANDGLIITRLEDGGIADVNPAMCEMHGYTKEEFLTLHPTRFIHPDDHYLFVEYIATVAEGGEYRCRARDIRKDGSMFHVEVLGTPVTYNGRRHILGVVRDMTAQVEAEQILERRVEERTGELSALLQVSSAVASTLDATRVARVILDELAEVAQYDAATLAVREGDYMVILDSWGPNADEVVNGPTARYPASAVPRDFWSMMGNGRPVIIGDIRDESVDARAFRKTYREYLELRSFRTIRSWMAVPLLRQGQVVGVLTASHDEPHRFSSEKADLLVAAASQAAVAIENARLFEQTEERTRELSTLLDVSTNIASKLTTDAIVDVILEELRALLDATGASVTTLEGHRALHLGSSNPDIHALVGRGTTFSMRRFGAIWEKLERQEPVLIADVRGEGALAEAYRRAVGPEIDGIYREVRSWMCLPLSYQRRLIGLMFVTHRNPGVFEERDVELARVVANQAAVAIENARLFEETEERTRELTTLLDASTTVASTIELQPLLQLILDQVRTVAEYDRAAVLILDDEKEALRVIATKRSGGEVAPGAPTETRFPVAEAQEFWVEFDAGRPVIIEDARDETLFARVYRRSAAPKTDPNLSQVRSWMAVPLTLQDRVIGIIALTSNKIGIYSERQASLTMAIATQAAAAIENARLFEQTQERTGELSTLLEVSRNVASTLDLRRLLDLTLEQVRHVAPYDGASFLVLHGDMLRIESESRERSTLGLELPTAGSLLWERASHGDTVLIDDVRGDTPEAESWRRAAGPLLDTRYQHVRNWLGVPILLGDRPLGLLALSAHQTGVFNPQHARLARAVADQAAVAIENARLYEEAGRRTRETEALLRADAELYRSLSLDDVFQALCDVAVDVLGMDKCMVTTIEDETGRYTTRASRGLSKESLARMTAIRERTPRAALARMTAPIITEDARTAIPEMREVFEAEGIVSTMDVPIRIEGKVHGDFAVARTRRHVPTSDEQRLFQALADRASVAIQNAALYERAQQAASLEERQRLARELHDSVSQALYGIALGARTARTQLDRDPARAVEPIEYVLSLAEAGLAEMRALIFELRPESLQTEGLVAAIEKQVASTRARYGLDVTAELGTEPDIRLDVKEALYRVAQEALHNVVKHAHANHVRVGLATANGHVALEVRDDGRGFDPDGSYPGHVGLHSMRERIEKLHGTITIESRPGDGASIEVRVPVHGVSA
ncbi:MAG: GAF domain-containing protein [Chloroflexi bacterium]|nr:GAF domain-containing protein [Chloroflexota bacterium]